MIDFTTLVTGSQLLAHLWGDYILQTDTMAKRKTTSLPIALLHALFYGLPFLFLRPTLAAWAVLVGSHAVIDRYRLARYLVWGKEWLTAPLERPKPLSECPTGYPKDKPDFLATWLLILADNTLHITLNALALRLL